VRASRGDTNGRSRLQRETVPYFKSRGADTSLFLAGKMMGSVAYRIGEPLQTPDVAPSGQSAS